MKKDTHPKYYDNAVIKCACGKTYTVGSTKEKIDIEVCAACHPFYTGHEKLLDIAGRVEKFKARRERAQKTLKKKK
ncbi:MAG: 50S ribosomal protein L31 [Patescibacteria group bacterium]